MLLLINHILRETELNLLTTLSGDVKLKHTSEALWVARALSLFKEANDNEKPILLMDGIPIVSRYLDVHLTISVGLRRYCFCYQ